MVTLNISKQRIFGHLFHFHSPRAFGSCLQTCRVAMLLYRLLAPQWEVFDGRHYGPPSWTAFRRKAPRKRGSAASAVIRTAVAGELFWVEGLDGGKRNEKIEKHVGDVLFWPPCYAQSFFRNHAFCRVIVAYAACGLFVYIFIYFLFLSGTLDHSAVMAQ